MSELQYLFLKALLSQESAARAPAYDSLAFGRIDLSPRLLRVIACLLKEWTKTGEFPNEGTFTTRPLPCQTHSGSNPVSKLELLGWLKLIWLKEISLDQGVVYFGKA